MKRRAWLSLLVILSLVLTGCCISHEWVEADCDSPKTCAKCEKTEGEPLGHRWVEATCAVPRTCSGCGLTEGEVLAHSWVEATCAAPKTCSVCGQTEGEPVHPEMSIALEGRDGKAVWMETCRDCGEVEEIVYDNWLVLLIRHFSGRWETTSFTRNGMTFPGWRLGCLELNVPTVKYDTGGKWFLDLEWVVAEYFETDENAGAVELWFRSPNSGASFRGVLTLDPISIVFYTEWPDIYTVHEPPAGN